MYFSESTTLYKGVYQGKDTQIHLCTAWCTCILFLISTGQRWRFLLFSNAIGVSKTVLEINKNKQTKKCLWYLRRISKKVMTSTMPKGQQTTKTEIHSFALLIGQQTSWDWCIVFFLNSCHFYYLPLQDIVQCISSYIKAKLYMSPSPETIFLWIFICKSRHHCVLMVSIVIRFELKFHSLQENCIMNFSSI